jgi:hypothetical protein
MFRGYCSDDDARRRMRARRRSPTDYDDTPDGDGAS